MGVKSNKKKPIVTGNVFNKKSCKVPESSVFFNFQYITTDDNYNLSRRLEKPVCKDLISALHKFSQSSWEELKKKGKNSGGFEMLEYGMMSPSIANKIKNKLLTNDTKLYVFRFGGKKYRMIGYKSNSCKAAMHILGFDIDFSLYNHGN